MMTLQNLDVHGTFGARQVCLKKSFLINALAVELYGFVTLPKAGLRDQSDRYRFDLQSKSLPEHAQAPIAERLFISEGSSTACQQEKTQ